MIDGEDARQGLASRLSHPNVVTVFDVGSDNGRAYVVMELLEGTTLGARVQRGAVPAAEALNLAAQAAAGLAAAHAHGIVHRDLKPDNLFLTTSGTLKVLDFGLARLHTAEGAQTHEITESNATGPGTVLGTVSYMSPEQARGPSVDARSDLFSLGVVLHEMLSGRHPFKRTSSAETVSAILRDEPPELSGLGGRVSGAVGRLVRRCLEKRPEDRFQSANDLALALGVLEPGDEATARRPSGTRGSGERATREERPYPGLSSFTEKDAAHFFGREEEVRALWEKVRRQKLLAVIGPSGVGKTSFLRAGLIAGRPAGWTAVYLTPGSSPVAALARAVSVAASGEGTRVPEDPGVVGELVQGLADFLQQGEATRFVAAMAAWRGRRLDVLPVVDQAEELFTLNPPETQERFATLVGGLVEEAGLHVLLSLRDDFLFQCHGLAALAPVFQDLTPLGPPSAAALRRALVEPAARLGVRFEDEALVEEMVGAVADERGALPLLAFTASRLWEERDRDRRLLTREDHEQSGGVEGALAQHAEATLQRIGLQHEAVVREIFRNLVTVEGTWAVREREELLSVFGSEPQAAAGTLDALIDARLLTEYDVTPAPSRTRFPDPNAHADASVRAPKEEGREGGGRGAPLDGPGSGAVAWGASTARAGTVAVASRSFTSRC